uniref:DNA primase large subunit C-terminal domain-containing protein n=1 Tax=Fibrocapsa japonica TaxID=94617 RepID=A0A7S2UXZ6_9STRA
MGTPPGAGETHGCPFRHYDERHLSALMTQLQVKSDDREEILSRVRAKHFQLACVKHFQVTHQGSESMSNLRMTDVGNHPNAWTEASLAYHKNLSGGSENNANAENVEIQQQQQQQQQQQK